MGNIGHSDTAGSTMQVFAQHPCGALGQCLHVIFLHIDFKCHLWRRPGSRARVMRGKPSHSCNGSTSPLMRIALLITTDKDAFPGTYVYV